MNLEGFKEGDFLAVYSGGGWYGTQLSKEKVVKATKAKIETEAHVFNRNGNIRGGSTWDRCHAEPWDESIHAPALAKQITEKNHRFRCNSLRDTKWEELPIEVVQQIYSTVKGLTA